MFGDFWPWWLSALALTIVAIGHYVTTGRPFGVSGLWIRVMRWRSERAAERDAEALLEDEDEFAAALMAAAMEDMGLEPSDLPDAVDPSDLPDAVDPVDDPPRLELAVDIGGHVPGRLPVSVGLTFLVAMIAGGALAALSIGDWTLQSDLGVEFVAIFGSDWQAIAALLGGGVLVGFGTSMAGGCTSGHGLNGCATLQPGSLVSTIAFFGTGVAVALLLGGM